MRPITLSAALLFLLAGLAPALAQSGANVLVVANRASSDSLQIAEYYARARGVPQDQVLRLEMSSAEEIERRVFEREIQAPIAAWLTGRSAQDRILYLVLAKGVPLRIRGSGGRTGTVASVDSELTLLYRRMTGVGVPVPGPIRNPYFLDAAPVAMARAFTHESSDIFLVTRLDGYTTADVLALIDRGVAPRPEGRVLLDQDGSLDQAGGNQWLQQAANWLTKAGFGDRVLLETSSRVLREEREVLGYYSWGSNDPAITTRRFDLRFVPGALAGMFVSTDARTFKEPPEAWNIGAWSNRAGFFAGSPQSLTGDLIREGVTGVAGHVAEPYLDATVRPHILFPAYFSGFTLAEAFYLAMPVLGWQTVVVGDPLCAPFPRRALQPSEIDKGLDPATELPAWFSARRARAAEATLEGRRPEAIRRLIRAEVRTARGDAAGARQDLEAAVNIDAGLVAAQLLLGTLDDGNGEHDRAMERYRAVLVQQPNQPIALNNLAYGLAVRKGQPREALPYAEKAYSASGADPTVADTLAWIQHLLGRHEDAVRLLAAAVRGAPDNAEIRLHAAVVYAATGQPERARQELDEALRLDPSLATRAEVAALRKKDKKK